MIFALIDYIKYRQQKGVYSLESIHKQGAALAEPSLLPRLEKYQPGDLLFVHTANSTLSWAVLYYTGPTIWSHCATFGKEGFLYDCTTRGVIEHHISDYFDGKSYIQVMSLGELPDIQRKKMRLKAEQLLGYDFNWEGIAIFWFRIITGNDGTFRVCHVVDILVLFIGLAGIFYKIHIIQCAFLILGMSYLLIVLFSRIRMNICCRKERLNEEFTKGKTIKKDEYIPGKDIVDDLINLSLEDLEKYFIPFEKDFAGIPIVIISAYNNMASKLTKVEEYDKAEMLIKKAIKYCDDSTSRGKIDIAKMLNNLAGMYFEKKDYGKLTETIETAKELLKDIDAVEAKDLYTRMQDNMNLFRRKTKRQS